MGGGCHFLGELVIPQESLSSIAITVGVLSGEVEVAVLFVSAWGYSPGLSLAVLSLGAVVWWVSLFHVVVCSGGGMRDTALHTVGGFP